MESDQTTLSWHNINIEVPDKNKRYRESRIKLVSDACGSIKCGLLAIMGPSGSGKTTLLNSFVGRMPQNSYTTGKILYFGKDRDGVEFTKKIGFVGQDDTIFESMTAYQTVKYAADFRLENSKKLNLEQKIQTLFEKLSIGHVKDIIMSSLSGSDRKRVMIAVELITEPQIIFLDEPTSGLDNNSSYLLIKLLKSITDEEKTIIFTINQPDDRTVSEFTKTLLLSRGRTVYMGDFANCESELKQYCLERKPRETFSNFALRVLNVDPDKYQESAYGSVLNTLVEEMKKRNNFQPGLKAVKKSNDVIPELAVNFEHVFLIINRKYQLSFLTLRNLIFNIILFAFTLCFVLWFRYLNRTPNLVISNKTPQEILDEACYRKFEDFLSSLIFISPFFSALLPMISGKAFYPETLQIKREINVATYSVTSYYLATYIYEFLRYLPYLIIYLVSISFNITEKSFILPIFFFNSLIFCCSLFFYLFIGSISSRPKLLTLFLVLAYFFIVFRGILLKSTFICVKYFL
ncbi:ATP-binding Cassette (ABC) Transporter [Pseudoloma neurophilia]|uniref:ATP-binding Cassette (ABC) Transporter n=1 Tax=Pseudoloma neurophilia TaxID=146866 RepID=A0A0R0M0A2_9MICR|nr:ATP-binding Cassette (ABC) Transporter [Pseudoloma neurophilia]